MRPDVPVVKAFHNASFVCYNGKCYAWGDISLLDETQLIHGRPQVRFRPKTLELSPHLKNIMSKSCDINMNAQLWIDDKNKKMVIYRFNDGAGRFSLSGPGELKMITMAHTGVNFAYVLSSGGEIYFVHLYWPGEFSPFTEINQLTENDKIIDIEIGSGNLGCGCYALTKEGNVYWGNPIGPVTLNNPKLRKLNVPKNNKIIKIAVQNVSGELFCLTENGYVYKSEWPHAFFKLIKHGIMDISCGLNHCIALDDIYVWGCGKNDFCQLGQPNTKKEYGNFIRLNYQPVQAVNDRRERWNYLFKAKDNIDIPMKNVTIKYNVANGKLSYPGFFMK